MNTTNKLLDKYAKACYATMDKELAKALRVRPSAVSNWRTGTAHPDADSIERMAEAIKEPVGPWLAQIEADRARTPANRQVWLRLAATLGATLALTIAALPAHANSRPNAQTSPNTAYCVKLLQRLRELAADLLTAGSEAPATT